MLAGHSRIYWQLLLPQRFKLFNYRSLHFDQAPCPEAHFIRKHSRMESKAIFQKKLADFLTGYGLRSAFSATFLCNNLVAIVCFTGLERSFAALPSFFNCARYQVRVQPSPGRTGARTQGLAVFPAIIHPVFRNLYHVSEHWHIHAFVGSGPLVIRAVHDGNAIQWPRISPPITSVRFNA
jgi:hypothetical protein